MKIIPVDDKELEQYSKALKEMPGLARVASAQMLNDLAFDLKAVAFKTISKSMIVRNKGFVSGSIRVAKAHSSQPIARMVATAGSIKRDRFSGWDEQEYGAGSHKTRQETLLARAGDLNRQILPSLRFKAGRQFDTPKGYSELQVGDFLREHSTGKSRNKPFLMRKKYKRMQKGLYRFVGQTRKVTVDGVSFKSRKIRLITRIRATPYKPKRNRWMRKARGVVLQNRRVAWTWMGAIRKSLASHLKKSS